MFLALFGFEQDIMAARTGWRLNRWSHKDRLFMTYCTFFEIFTFNVYEFPNQY